MIVSILIPIIIMFFGRCLTVLRYRQIVYSFLRYLLENIIFACNQFVNPSRQVMMMMNCFCGMVDRRKAFSLIPAGTIVRDPHHRKSPTRREQGLNLRRT